MKEWSEDALRDYVGDRVEFIDSKGLWFERQLRYDEVFGCYIKHKGHIVPVKPWGNDAVLRRVRERRDA